MNDIEILEDYLKYIKNFDNNSTFIPALENLIKENKELKEEISKYEKQLDLDYVEENYIARAEIIKLLNKEIINISGFECIAKSDIEKLLED